MRRLTSARFGTFFSVTVSGVSRLAIMSGKVAFLAPLIGMVPWRRFPPLMRILSMMSAGNDVSAGARHDHDGQARPAASAPQDLGRLLLNRLVYNLSLFCVFPLGEVAA